MNNETPKPRTDAYRKHPTENTDCNTMELAECLPRKARQLERVLVFLAAMLFILPWIATFTAWYVFQDCPSIAKPIDLVSERLSRPIEWWLEM